MKSELARDKRKLVILLREILARVGAFQLSREDLETFAPSHYFNCNSLNSFFLLIANQEHTGSI